MADRADRAAVGLVAEAAPGHGEPAGPVALRAAVQVEDEFHGAVDHGDPQVADPLVDVDQQAAVGLDAQFLGSGGARLLGRSQFRP